MTTAAIFAQGTLVKLDDGAGNYTTIAEAKNVSGPGLKAGTIDVTSHDSPNSFREFIGGLREGGQLSFDINYAPGAATHNATTGLIAKGWGGTKSTKTNIKIVFPDIAGTTWTLPCFVTDFTPLAPVDKELSAQIKVQVAGAPTLA